MSARRAESGSERNESKAESPAESPAGSPAGSPAEAAAPLAEAASTGPREVDAQGMPLLPQPPLLLLLDSGELHLDQNVRLTNQVGPAPSRKMAGGRAPPRSEDTHQRSWCLISGLLVMPFDTTLLQ